MSDLRTLFPDSRYTINVSSLSNLSKLYVYNTSTNTPSNGGFCCGWTVPAGVGWAMFEVWGGGGGGGGGCCCQQPYQPGGSGSYSRKTISVTAGTVFTLCAASSTTCSPTCLGQVGFPSYACNAAAGLCLCASGGMGGCNVCFQGYFGANPHAATFICGSTCGGSFSLCGLTGASHTNGCGSDSFSFTPAGPVLGGGVRVSMDSCLSLSGCASGGVATFPSGGGGASVTNAGSCCWGGWGAGGLIVVTYK